MSDTTTQPVTDDQQKLTKRDEHHLKELEHFADQLEKDNLLYGSALDGMEPGVKAAADALDASDIEKRLAAADEELVAKATEMLKADADDMAAISAELDADDEEEQALLAGDEEEADAAA